MIIRFYFVCVSAVLIKKVSLQVTGVVGGSVVLPCSSTEHDHKAQDTEVHWRQNGKILFDIINGEDSLAQQNPQYKNRTETFPEEYVTGNFSIKLNNLQHTDSGKYICLISHSSEHKTVELIINETTAEHVTKSPMTKMELIRKPQKKKSGFASE
ncbi:myelin-oligodendrocyte glycoprotein-like [Puntigrus tetrazona]|uniref:myelin-oligodendrocyte glycoprotein-like n=1 Tax=Puntigrus tetrazona TaxID=1606681 RepID=UPI001C8A2AD1|nr:myelin-oligodendrocyte glycoprotein-like [Puntigrus tetrazona]